CAKLYSGSRNDAFDLW
nr:immunoglobulin heavy chain junction region [Macaca mulatta]MOW32223.1 immunoglobulin heavy chain junction region [Macaca mulatta]MOW32446.1 immunoglobulin heavy chain junction region [Macaca mulatta]MOW32588.1 immunoglobulin heavy chain junction region [Macaca mulatta]MOW33410.1 immunoglobulin heavy chain junction region [Macaca mulatta]